MLNNIKSFGLNVIPEGKKVIENAQGNLEDVTISLENALSGLWEPILGYLEENDNVFSGDVNKEIDKIIGQSMKLDMTLNATTEKRSLSYEG